MYVYLAAAIIVLVPAPALWLIRSTAALNAVVALIVLLPLVPTLPGPATPLHTRAPFTSAPSAQSFDGANVLFEPFPGVDYPQAMTWQRSANFIFTMVGGYVIGPYAPGVAGVSAADPSTWQRGSIDADAVPARLALISASFAPSTSATSSSIRRDVPAGTPSLFTQIVGAPPSHARRLPRLAVRPFH